jgi:hypothetical protein
MDQVIVIVGGKRLLYAATGAPLLAHADEVIE